MGVSANNQMLSLKMRGAEGLADALRALGNDPLVKRILKRALLEESRPAAAEARRLMTRRKTGVTAEKIEVSTTLSRRQSRGRRRRKAGDLEAEVFIGAGPRGPAVLQEFGTVERKHKNGKSVGHIPAQPFMRPAWEKWKYRILDRFALRVWYEIEKAAERQRKKQMRKLKESSRKR